MPATARGTPDTWPLVGRTDELEWLTSVWRDRSQCGVVISGSTGVGKSRLAREALAVASSDGAATNWVQATQAAAEIPLGAFASLFPASTELESPLVLLQRSSEAIASRAAGSRRVVLCIDDAHLLDASSATLVLHVATNRMAFIVATIRAGEPCPDPIVALWKDLGAPRLDLQHLSEEETAALLEAGLDGEVSPSVSRWAFDLSEGHPLYLRELVRAALAGRSLVLERGHWTLGAPFEASPALVELITSNLDRLTAEELDAVRLLALGEPIGLDVVARILPLATLTSLEGTGVAVVGKRADTGGRDARLGHPLFGEVVRGSMPAIRGFELRILLANAVRANEPTVPGDALRIATWLDEAGADIDEPILLAAAGEAISAGDPDLADRLAVRAGHHPRAVLIRAISAALRRRFDEAEALLASIDGPLDDRALAISYLEWRALRVLHLGLLRSDDALALLDGAETWFPDDVWRSRVDLIRLQISMTIWGPGTIEALERLGDLLERPDLIPEVRRRVSITYALTLHFAGQAGKARSISAQLRPSLPLRDGDDAYALTIWVTARQEAGYDWEEIEPWLLDAERATARSRDPLTRGEVLIWFAVNAFRRGRLRRASRAAREAVDLLEGWDALRRLPLAWLILGMAAALRGDTDEARSALDGYDRSSGDSPVPFLWRQELSVRAVTLAAGGETSRAAAMLLEGAERAAAQPTEQMHLLHEALRAGADPQRVATALGQVRQTCDAPLAVIFEGLAVAHARRDGAALMESASAFEALGAYPWAAEAAALAAIAHRMAGREDSARRALTQCVRYRNECEGFWSPILASVELTSADLTEREREIVALAATGSSNAEIAERLVVSVRTVESHLYRAMQKLGVNSRQDLPPS